MGRILSAGCLCILAVSVCFAQTTDPVADSQATVIAGNARFTVLTPRVIRLEWAEDGSFEDRASHVFIHRNTPAVKKRVTVDDSTLTIATDYLRLTYEKGSGPFTEENLSIAFTLAGEEKIWKPGMQQTGNLRGTARTLDGYNGGVDGDGNPIELCRGAASRDGWVLFDDSDSFLFDDSDWPWPVRREEGNRLDWYFFGHGHDYTAAMADFTLIAGKIPLPPRFAFGYWWSRYWAYSDQELRNLVQMFKSMDIPMDVLIIDMDWHKTFGFSTDVWERDEFGLTLGWTGYTWNRRLFPDPETFLKWTDDQNLKTALNLHPASGIPSRDDAYQAFAAEVGFDTSTSANIPYAMADKQWAETYFNLLLQPFIDMGIDFWWIDWQQFPTSKIMEGLNNTWWLNYTFFTHTERTSDERPLLFHRWGGLGNHRYQIGFSGDAFISWEELAFQPYFTATAANVGYGYWSHDIGGHHQPGVKKPTEGELYLRWLQFGIFSPIVRTHSTKSVLIERRFWRYPDHFKDLRAAIHLRYALAPYIYNAARAAYDTGVSLVRPLYYHHPEVPEAYEHSGQYYFGPDMLLAPVTKPVNPQSELAEKEIWLPEGLWYEWFSGTLLEGGQTVKRSFALNEIPVYIKAGAIVPFFPKVENLQSNPDQLILKVMPGRDGLLNFYEDDGNSQAYKRGEFSNTRITSLWDGNALEIVIGPRTGQFQGMRDHRTIRIDLVHSFPPDEILLDGRPLEYSPETRAGHDSYNGHLLQCSILLPPLANDEQATLTVSYSAEKLRSVKLLNGLKGTFERIARVATLLKEEGTKASWRSAVPPIVQTFEQTPTRLTYFPGRALEEIQAFNSNYQQFLDAIMGFDDVSPELRQRISEYLK